MLHTEMSRLWSAGIISVFADAMAKFDSETNSITKYGKHLKVNDIILRNVDENGKPSKSQYSWKVASLLYAQSLGLDNLKVGEDYLIYMKEEESLRTFKLTFFCLGTKTYHFMSLEDGVNDLKVDACTLPSIYSKHITRHAGIQSVVLESVKGGENGVKLLDELFMNDIENEKFILDVGQCHVIEAIGKLQF
jgi:hypothetical protein